MQKKALTLSLSVFLMTACSHIPNAAYNSRTGPESLLDVSSEQVNVSLNTAEGLDQLVEWLNDDQPTRIALYCGSLDDICGQAQEIIEQFAVPYDVYVDPQNQATLVYDRVIARDCDHRYMTNHINPYNLNHPTFGCSTAANQLQMIADKQQIISPALTDHQDARKMTQSMDKYLQPSALETDAGSLIQ